MKNKFAALIIVIMLTACFGNSKPTQFYGLSTEVKAGTAQPVKSKPYIILVGPLEVAKYLDRTNMISAISGNEFDISELNVWAEPIDRAAIRVISQNLENALADRSLSVSPWQNLAQADMEIPMAIERFHCEVNGSCFLRILWTIQSKAGKVSAPSIHEYIKLPKSGSYSDQAKALSELLADASLSLVSEIKQIKR